mmetsp:Transcript_2375/g.6700  ORF Transcript_2375/g.6700 Transcript_2375/m.6700 type:complete len:197 (+) Transcript_2375:75-665(+)
MRLSRAPDGSAPRVSGSAAALLGPQPLGSAAGLLGPQPPGVFRGATASAEAAAFPNPTMEDCSGATVIRRPERASLPAPAGHRREPPPQHGAGPTSELLALRAEVARLQEDAKRDALEKEQLRRQVERLQGELRKTMEENRSLWTSNEERKNVLAQATAKEEAAARESALDNARDLFRSMLSDNAAKSAGKVGTAW